jgi:hypothetical protein
MTDAKLLGQSEHKLGAKICLQEACGSLSSLPFLIFFYFCRKFQNVFGESQRRRAASCGGDKEGGGGGGGNAHFKYWRLF